MMEEHYTGIDEIINAARDLLDKHYVYWEVYFYYDHCEIVVRNSFEKEWYITVGSKPLQGFGESNQEMLVDLCKKITARYRVMNEKKNDIL